MRFLRDWITAGLLCISTGAFASASFDGGSKLLTLSAVKVGGATYANVVLLLINPANYTFRLQAATPQMPAGPADITFDASTGVLTIPSVTVGNSAYSVTFQLIDTSTYTFLLTSATLLTSTTSGNASACFSSLYFTTGATSDLTYQASLNGTVASTYENKILVTGPQTFNGQTAIEFQQTTYHLTGLQAGQTTQSSTYMQNQGLDVFTLGDTTSATSHGVTINTVSTYTPALRQNFALNAGQSVTTTSTQTVNGSTSSQITETFAFAGFEDVKVPAGSFAQACKWQITLVINGNAYGSTEWFTRSGVLLQLSSGGVLTQLTAGTVNGGAIGP